MFSRRLAGGLDLGARQDPLSAAWKSLVLDETPKASTSSYKREPPSNAARKQLSFVSSQGSPTSPAFSEILIYPGAPKKKERKRSAKHSLLRHLTAARAIKMMVEEEKEKCESREAVKPQEERVEKIEKKNVGEKERRTGQKAKK